jgi:hypothetical protein
MALLLAVGGLPQAFAINIDNGVVGDGFWQVDVQNGGDSFTGNLNPTGAIGNTEVIFEYYHMVDVGANGGGTPLSSTTITSPTALSGPDEVSSAGSFAGQNGTINWSAVSSIAAGSPLYLTELTFTSSSPFGVVRLIQYLDEDVLGFSDDRLIVLGTPGADDFQLLTVDNIDNVGVSHAATYNTALGMDYIGWAARPYRQLLTAIEGAGAAYSIPGIVTGIPAIDDPRYSSSQEYGTLDITSAIAFDLDPLATSASVIFSLGGSPSGAPTPPPTAPEFGGQSGTGTGWVFGLTGALLGLAVIRRGFGSAR